MSLSIDWEKRTHKQVQVCTGVAQHQHTFQVLLVLDIIEIKEKKNLFEAVNFEFMLKKVWFGLDRGLGQTGW